MKKWAEVTSKTITTYEIPDLLAEWLGHQMDAYDLVMRLRKGISIAQAVKRLPQELQDMIAVTTEPNLGKNNGYTISKTWIDGHAR